MEKNEFASNQDLMENNIEASAIYKKKKFTNLQIPPWLVCFVVLFLD